MARAFLLVFLLPVVLSEPLTTSNIQFDRNVTGVMFSPYVHRTLPDITKADWSDYKLDDLKAMMNVINDRFSKIATDGVGAFKDDMNLNNYSEVLTSEAAALINLEQNHKGAKISVFVGIEVHQDATQLDHEVNLAKKSAQNANRVFASTVEGLIFTRLKKACTSNCHAESVKYIETTVNKIKDLKRENLKLKLGSRQNCTEMFPYEIDSPHQLQANKAKEQELVEVSDFIICEFYPNPNNKGNEFWGKSNNDFTRFTRKIKNIKSDIKIMGLTGISARSGNRAELRNFRDFWLEAENFAKRQNLDTIWIQEAFDNPWKTREEADMGWWESTDDKNLHDENNYEEKVMILRDEVITTTTTTTTPKTTTTTARSTSNSTPKPRSGASCIFSPAGSSFGVAILTAVILALFSITRVLV